VRFLKQMGFHGGSFGHTTGEGENIQSYFLSLAFNTWNCLNCVRTLRQSRYYKGMKRSKPTSGA
jgi:hypothetical protein